MNIPLSFIQLIYSVACILFSVSFSINYFPGGLNLVNTTLGIIGGGVLVGLFLGIDTIIKKFNLRSLNIAVLGLFFGYLLGESVLLSLNGMLRMDVYTENFLAVRFFTFLVSTYIGIKMTMQASEELHLSIPFLELKKVSQKKKDILVDTSILSDTRVIDLATTGLLDHLLIIPRFAIRDLNIQAESQDETLQSKARRSLDVIKKLESMSSLDLRYTDTDFQEIKDPMTKLIRLARFLDTNIITSDINRIQQSSFEGVRFINIQMLSNALKPITQAGESINIKIQRYGKEARQGVGYLEDGTMVVVNGGAEFIGETIKGYVLSVKHTSSGRMIFCNAAEEGSMLLDQDKDYSLASLDYEEQKSYLTL